MQLFSDDKSNFVKITEILAQFFRIYEDYIDLTQNSSEVSTLPFIYFFLLIICTELLQIIVPSQLALCRKPHNMSQISIAGRWRYWR
jgi:hypothetical protein